MLAAVEFDNQLLLDTNEVRDVAGQTMLAAEFVAELVVA
jgi:hypothetical protein